MESKKINQLATELTPALSDLTIIGDPTTGISKKITLSQMASLFTGTVEEYANLAAFPLVGVADTIYIALDTNIIYRWNTGTNAYVELSPNIVTSLVFSDANGFDGTISLVGSTATLTITTALTTGSVPFIGASGALSQDNANLFFDDTNNRLGINTNAPTTALDVFGSGIIGRINGTSTNNAFLGFASAGTNKWSIGNVQSDHRFRIYNEATTSELVSVLSTGEFGIGIANPTTKLHIDGGASALIANLDANVSVAKSISFRSDNSARFNIEVSGTESGSNAGADFAIKRYSDAGAFIDSPISIVRSTGVVSIPNLSLSGLTGIVGIANGGTGSSTKNFVDLTTAQTIAGAKTFSNNLIVAPTVYTGAIQFGTSAEATIAYDGGAGLVSFNINAGAVASSPYYQFKADTVAKVTILKGGNVGIGISNPSYQLDVQNTSAITPVRFLGGNEGLRLDTSSTSYDTSIRFYNNNSATYWGGVQAGPGALSGGGMNIYNNGAYPMAFSVNGAERIRISASGNVGIATTNTTYAALNIKASGVQTYNGITIFSTDGTESFFGIGNSGSVVGFNATYGATGSYLPITFTTGGSERLRIATDGITTIRNTLILGTSSFVGNIQWGTSGYGTSDYNAGNGKFTWQSSAGASSGTIYYSFNADSFGARMTIANNGNVVVAGNLSKASGSFRIDHPLESMTETHQLVHSFIEGPKADLIYRGKLTLVKGKAQANIDEVSTMTEGTFEVLCREVQCFTTNESGWDLIKGKVIGNIIYIESQNPNSTDEISWLVIGERKDKHMMDTDMTDENGKVIVEPLKPIKEEIEEQIIKEEIIEEEIIENINK